jgi:uncharacterized lipoprotein YmbA
MKPGFCVSRVAFALVMAVLLTGCLFRKSPVTVRHFILSPITTNEPQTAATEHLSVGIGVVKMPSYLLRDSLAVRNGDNEIQYLEGAQWGERLDQSFQRTVAANLSRLLSSDRVYSTDWARNQVLLRVFINVQQFEVDTKGHGTLVAHWRITSAGTDTPLKNGTARMDRVGNSPHGNPGVIAVTLSDLTSEFSRDLAQSILEQAKSR